MITEFEKQKMKEIEEHFHAMAVQLHGEDISPELKAEFTGANLATMDVLFAIREGTEWRGMTDPKEMVQVLLRQGGLTDQ